MFKKRKMEIGLALGGGAIRGAAHIGILKTLAENDVEIKCISGTSSGGIAAALFAFGVPFEEMRQFVEGLSWYKISNLALPRLGLFSNEDLGEHIVKLLGDVQIENAKIPLTIVAGDITTGEQLNLQEGSLAQAIRATTCIPGLYIPVKWGDRLLVDGMIVENVPITPLVEMGASYKVAVDVVADCTYAEPQGVIDVMVNAFEIALDAHKKQQLELADFVIAPDLSLFDRTDASKIQEIISKGESDASTIFPMLKKRYNRKKRTQLFNLFG